MEEGKVNSDKYSNKWLLDKLRNENDTDALFKIMEEYNDAQANKLNLYTLEDCHKLACYLISGWVQPHKVKEMILNNR